MKVIPFAEAMQHVTAIAEVLADGGVASFPMGGAYRLAADLRSPETVNRLFQMKRRAKSHPALVLVPSLAAARPIVDGTSWATTRRLAERLWPSPLTLVLPPSEELPSALRRLIARSTGKIGVRVPDEPLAAATLRSFGGPLLLSSANLENKPGSASAAALRQRFSNNVALWVDAGDVSPAPPSTLVEVTEDACEIVREGAVAREKIEQAMAGVGRAS